MRGRIAAACAAVLVGLAPAGLLACVPLLSAPVWACAAPAPARDTRRLVSSKPALPEAADRVAHGFAEAGAELVRDVAEEAPAIWRSPSGPAPSQGPPPA